MLAKQSGTAVERMRHTTHEIKNTLDTLDQAEKRGRPNEKRQRPRFKYRTAEVTLELMQPGGAWKRYSCPPRNISGGGIGVIFGQFIYPQTLCKLHLTSLYGHHTVVPGKVARCRYLAGSNRLHEVGIQFDQPIDIAMFHRDAVPTHVLLADDDPAMHSLVPKLLGDLNVTVVSTHDGASAVEKAMAGAFDVALVDMQMPKLDGPGVARELRSKGYCGPLIAITAQDSEESRKQCLEAGFDAWVAKPFNRQTLTAAVASLRDDPIVSSLIDDKSIVDVIDEFVGGLRDKVRELQGLLTANNLDGMAKMLRTLRADAGGTGFDPIAETTQEIESLIDAKAGPDVLRSKASQLTRLCLAARGVSCVEVK